MARVARMVLDLALVSLGTAKPAVSKVWLAAKSAVSQTKARPVVQHSVVSKIESSVGSVTDMMMEKLRQLRNQLLPKEEQYLIKQLENCRRKMKETTSKALRPPFATAWQYAKIEIVPPMTIAFFNGPAGAKLENKVAEVVDGFIGGLDKKIKEIDEAEAAAIREKEAKIKAAEEAAKAKLKEEQKKKAAELAAKAKKAEESKKAEAKSKEEKAEKKDAKKEEKPKDDKKPPAKK